VRNFAPFGIQRPRGFRAVRISAHFAAPFGIPRRPEFSELRPCAVSTDALIGCDKIIVVGCCVMPLRIRVNGSEHDVAAEPDTPLLQVLRNDLELNSPKFGCGLGQCGACTVHVDGAPRRACVTNVSAVVGKSVVTLEGLGTPERPHPLQQAFIDEQAAQCGYCINGMIMRAAALLAQTPRPTRDDITSALSSNLCRCGTHMRIVRAVARAAEGGAPAPAGREG
jgi:nicotinate dehydrogenase subunit A